MQAKAPTRIETDTFIANWLATSKVADADDLMYLWTGARDFDVSADLETIRARGLVINFSLPGHTTTGHTTSVIRRSSLC